MSYCALYALIMFFSQTWCQFCFYAIVSSVCDAVVISLCDAVISYECDAEVSYVCDAVILKIHPFTKIAVTGEPMKQFKCPLRFRISKIIVT